jgi:PAS domain S-box-containing protein
MKFYIDKLRKIRRRHKLTIEELSRKMGIHRTTYCGWEYGKRVPSEAKIRLLAKSMNISVNEISDIEPEIPVSQTQYSKAVQSWINISQLGKNEQENKIDYIRTMAELLNKELSDTKLIINALLLSISSMFYVKDTNLKYITANVAFLKNIKLNQNYSVLNKIDTDFFNITEAGTNEKQDNEVLITGKSILNKEGYIPGSRKKKWGMISKIPVLNSEGRIEGIVGSFIDITDRKKTEQIRELLEANINLMNDAVFVRILKSGTFFYMNKAVEKIYGYALEQFRSKKGVLFLLDDCVHPDDKEQENKYETLNSWPKSRNFRIIRPGGETRYIHSYYNKIEYDGRTCVLFVNRDVTEIVQKQNSEQFMKLILERAMYHLNDIVWIIDSNLNCVLLTGPTEKLYGRSFDNEKDKMNFWKEKILDSEYWLKNRNIIEEFKADAEKFSLAKKRKQKLDNITVPNTWTYKTKSINGQHLYIETSFAYMVYNEELYALSIDRNITDRYEAGLKLNTIKEYLESENSIPMAYKEKLLSCL